MREGPRIWKPRSSSGTVTAFKNVLPFPITLADCAAASSLFYADWVEKFGLCCREGRYLGRDHDSLAERGEFEPSRRCSDKIAPLPTR
jgi:hypothetical protein